jgi:hypothetical protein
MRYFEHISHNILLPPLFQTPSYGPVRVCSGNQIDYFYSLEAQLTL